MFSKTRFSPALDRNKLIAPDPLPVSKTVSPGWISVIVKIALISCG